MRWAAIMGGGAKGVWALKVLSDIEAAEGPFDGYSGESIGAIAAVVAGTAGARDGLEEWLDRVGPREIYRGGGLVEKIAVALGKRNGVFDLGPGLETTRAIVAGRRIREGVRVTVTISDLLEGEFIEVDCRSDSSPDDVVAAAYRSCLVPVAHGAALDLIASGRKVPRWADGGVLATTPLEPAFRAGADEVVVVMLSNVGPERIRPEKLKSPLVQAGRAVDLMRHRLLLADLTLADRINRHPLPELGERRIKIRLFRPRSWLGEWMDFSREANVGRLAVQAEEISIEQACQAFRWRRVVRAGEYSAARWPV